MGSGSFLTSVFPPAEPKTERDGREVNIRDLKRLCFVSVVLFQILPLNYSGRYVIVYLSYVNILVLDNLRSVVRALTFLSPHD